jgi:hypothetical protein
VCVARCSAIAKPVAFLNGMYCFCKTNPALCGCWCVKPGPQRIATATRPGVWNRLPAFDPSRELHRVPAPWITTATRPGVRAPCVGAAGKRTAADHNCIPARRWESLTCIRSIEGTASSPGPMDHNCNPARCVCWCVKPGPQRITTATRPGVRRSMNPPTGATPSSTGPQRIHNCNPARCVELNESTHGSNPIEYRPAADHNCNPAQRVELDEYTHGSNAI